MYKRHRLSYLLINIYPLILQWHQGCKENERCFTMMQARALHQTVSSCPSYEDHLLQLSYSQMKLKCVFIKDGTQCRLLSKNSTSVILPGNLYDKRFTKYVHTMTITRRRRSARFGRMSFQLHCIRRFAYFYCNITKTCYCRFPAWEVTQPRNVCIWHYHFVLIRGHTHIYICIEGESQSYTPTGLAKRNQ